MVGLDAREGAISLELLLRGMIDLERLHQANHDDRIPASVAALGLDEV